MERREFIKKGAAAGIIAGYGLTFDGINRLFAAPYSDPDTPYDLVAVKGGAPEEMFEKAIEALGGMKKYIKPGQTVVVKPNIGWDRPPEMAANTNPGLVAGIIKHCSDAGAGEVFVFDNTCDNWLKCYENSGIQKAVKDAGGIIVPGNNENDYREVEIPSGKKLTNAKVHKLILDSDVFINVPILKSHGSTRLTIAMKNLMGIVWNRKFWHISDLHQKIADFATYGKPHLNIVDAYAVMMSNGPKGVSKDDVNILKSLIVSSDIVAADTAAAKIFGIEPDEIQYIKLAAEMGVGKMDLESLSIKRIKMDCIKINYKAG
ncbi:MAG: DUF362 domain-containing protein [Bacteroidetes bacterium]|nr:DUF362 domain-containing protein [Bacteroidota bacterium]